MTMTIPKPRTDEAEAPVRLTRSQLGALGGVEVEPGIWCVELPDGSKELVFEEVPQWTTCGGCGDLMAVAPEVDRCPWCERETRS